ncbi:MAG: FecR family protein [Firmicutes bacterium]|nr:FecR family protein [Bacillota bacterium]
MARVGYSDYFAKDQAYARSRRQPHNNFPIFTLLFLLVSGALIYYFFFIPGNNTTQKANTGNPLVFAFVDNSVGIYRNNPKKMEQAKSGALLYQGDTLDTGETKRTILKFDKDDNIRLSAETQIIYAKFSDDTYQIKLLKGSIWFETYEHKYIVETPSGLVDFSAGRVMISADIPGETTAYCFTGKVNLISRKANKQYLSFSPGEMVKISKDFEVSGVQRFQPDKLDAWIKWNLSFSGKNLREGSVPPALRIETASADLSENDQSIYTPAKVKQFSTKDSIKFVKDPSASKEIISDSSKERNIPKIAPKQKIPTAKSRISENEPPKIELPSLPEPSYPTNNNAPDRIENTPVKNTIASESTKQNREEYEKASQKDRKDRFNKGAYYYLDNTQRGEAKVPGYDLHSDPVGPAQNASGYSSNYDPPGFLTSPPPGR